MSMFNSINTSASGLSAQRLTMDIISDNIANVNTTRVEGEKGPYRRKLPVFAPRQKKFMLPVASGKVTRGIEGVGEGVRVLKVVKQDTPPKFVWDPTHPDAMKDGKKKGYVAMPNISVVKEMVDLIAASRAYEANVTCINTSKSMLSKALTISGKG